MGFDVVTFGSAMMDAFVETNTKEANGYLQIPYGCKQLMKSLFFEIGGGGTNTAVAFSRLGLKTGYIGKIGRDKNGESVLDMMRKEKIEFLGKVTGGETSGFSVVLISKARYRSILAYKGINDTISEQDVKPFCTKWLYLSSMMKKSFQTQIKLAKKLKKEGVKIAFNPSEYLIRGEDLKPLLKITNVLVVNKEEASMLTKDRDKLKGIAKLGPRIIVITDERRSISCYDGNRIYGIKPPRVKIADKTGAGDAFSAAFVAGLIKTKPIEYCLKLGVKEAVSVVRHMGAKNILIKKRIK